MRPELILAKTHKLDVRSAYSKHFIVVGAGGNGGYLIPNLARQVAIQNEMRKVIGQTLHKITVIDADEVENKNLVRQNFVEKDIGKNKADVMAQRYSRAFGVEISFMSKYIENPEMLGDVVDIDTHTPVILGCVDNNKTRVIMNDFHKSCESFYVDLGNEEFAGQMVVGYNGHGRGHSQPLDDEQVNGPYRFDLPSIVDIHPEVSEATDKLPHEMSCAESAVSHPQNIMTNQTAANLAMNVCNTLLTANILEGEGLDINAVYFNAKVPSFTTIFNKAEIIKENQNKSRQTQSVS